MILEIVDKLEHQIVIEGWSWGIALKRVGLSFQSKKDLDLIFQDRRTLHLMNLCAERSKRKKQYPGPSARDYTSHYKKRQSSLPENQS